ncbi:MAG: hypothetical protein C0412_01800 [Flavobacterium sp.]|nr:hypothetical protein [Flavobacterium sp.]
MNTPVRKIILIPLIFISALIQLTAAPIVSSPVSKSDSKPSWVISKNLIFSKNGEAKNKLVKTLIRKLESFNGSGSRVTKEEFIALLEREEVKTSYPEVLVRYATPESEEITKTEHTRFLEIHLKENNISRGIDFLRSNDKWLSEAEKKYGVLKQDLVSLFEWECGLGRVTGNYNPFIVLLSQVLFLNDAQKYAVNEMVKKGEENPFTNSTVREKEKRRIERRRLIALDAFVSLLRNCKQYKLDPLLQKSSWGGALGYVQFMPNNFKYGVDADRDGNVDLWAWPDAIFSAANFLQQKGKYAADYQSRKKAFYKYNPSTEYAQGVVIYADEIWKRYIGN